jgi:hypothetical protein
MMQPEKIRFIFDDIFSRVLLISAKAMFLSPTCKYARSISTETLGKSLIKKLIAVPPFKAKTFSTVMYGNMRSNNSACL